MDGRRKCFHPDEQDFCKKGKRICEEMKPIKGEYHRLIKTYEWYQNHRMG